MQRYELTTMTIGVGAGAKASAGIAAYCADSAASGRLLGCWASELGALNQVAVLRGFDSEADLAAERDRGLRSSNPFGCGEIASSLSMDSYAPFPGIVPQMAPATLGPVYEIRSYVLKLGGLVPTVNAWVDAAPARTELSKLVIVMHTLDGPPRITHIWPYASLNDRAAIRVESVRLGVWPPKDGPLWLGSMQSSIFLPLDASPLK